MKKIGLIYCAFLIVICGTAYAQPGSTSSSNQAVYFLAHQYLASDFVAFGNIKKIEKIQNYQIKGGCNEKPQVIFEVTRFTIDPTRPLLDKGIIKTNTPIIFYSLESPENFQVEETEQFFSVIKNCEDQGELWGSPVKTDLQDRLYFEELQFVSDRYHAFSNVHVDFPSLANLMIHILERVPSADSLYNTRTIQHLRPYSKPKRWD